MKKSFKKDERIKEQFRGCGEFDFFVINDVLEGAHVTVFKVY